MHLKNLWRAGAIALAVLLLNACGVQRTYNAQFRLFNASADFGSVDLLVDSTSIASGVAYGSASGYVGFNHGNSAHTIHLQRSGQSLDVLTTTATFSDGGVYTVAFAGSEASPKLVLIDDREAAPASGQIKVRVYNAATSAGSIDVYLAAPGADLSGQTPLQTAASPGALPGYSAIDAGSYEIDVTTTGDATDVRLRVGAQAFADGAIDTVFVLPSTSGALVNGALLPQGGTPQLLANGLSRVRFAFAAAGAETATATLADQTLASNVGGTAVSSYRALAAGAATLNVTLSNGMSGAQALTLAPATDQTVLIASDGAQVQTRLLADDNRLPANTSAFTVRTVNLGNGIGPVDLLANYAVVTSGTDALAASAYAQLANGIYDLAFQGPSGVGAVAALSNVSLAAQSVYSLFLFGPPSGASIVLRKDR